MRIKRLKCSHLHARDERVHDVLVEDHVRVVREALRSQMSVAERQHKKREGVPSAEKAQRQRRIDKKERREKGRGSWEAN